MKDNKNKYLYNTVILTIIVFILQIAILFYAIKEANYTIFVTSTFFTFFIFLSLWFLNKGKNRPSFVLISAIINSIYSFLYFIGLIISYVYLYRPKIEEETYFNTFIIVFLIIIAVLTYLFIWLKDGYIAYLEERKLNGKSKK